MDGFIIWIIILFIIFASKVAKEEKKRQSTNKQMGQPDISMPQKRERTSVWDIRLTPDKPIVNNVKPKVYEMPPQDDIVKRAKMNNDHFNKDETLDEIEKMHGHKENEKAISFTHQPVCDAHYAEIGAQYPEESIFGNAQDLIAKGFDGNMQFDRDFVSEAMDMINNLNV